MVNDLSSIPKFGDVFIDTSVLVYVHGMLIPSELYEKYHKQNAYINALGALLKDRRKLVTTWLNVIEMLHVHERHMREEYESLYIAPSIISKRDYRQIAEQRMRVQAELKRILGEIRTYYTVISAEIQESTVDRFVNTYDSHSFDSNDFHAVESAISNKVTIVISDDSDFYSDIRLATYTY